MDIEGKPREGDLSRRERQLLDALYRLGKASAAEIREAVEDPPTYTAVRTHLSNLEAKGFVKFESDGTRYIYEPAVPREKMAEAVMSNVMETFFDNRLELIVSSLISRKEANVSKEDLDKLAAIIDEARKEGR
jgi:predicted transcriptional regulator